MNRTAIMIVCITLLCGLFAGWLGGITFIKVTQHSENAKSKTNSIATLPETKNNSPDTVPAGSEVADIPAVNTIAPEQAQNTPIVVSVNGAVRRPGVYTFENDARVKDGIQTAGGAIAEADMDDINIAARLIDNTALYVPFKMFRQHEDKALVARRMPSAAQNNPARYTRSGWTQGEPPGMHATQEAPSELNTTADVPAMPTDAPTDKLVNLNTATLDELQTLPGIGPKTAEKIEAYRKAQPFKTIDDLESVNGIGPKTMESIRALVTVQ